MSPRCLVAVLPVACAAGCSRSKAEASVAGAQLYQQSCRGCHGSDGKGAPTACPPLAGHAAKLLSAPGGRAHLVRVPLFGLAGPIEVAAERARGLTAQAVLTGRPALRGSAPTELRQ